MQIILASSTRGVKLICYIVYISCNVIKRRVKLGFEREYCEKTFNLIYDGRLAVYSNSYISLVYVH